MSGLVMLLGVLAACPEGPSPARVLEQAAALRGPVAAPAWSLAFSPGSDGVELSASLDGQRWRRTLPATATCAALEEAAAVVLLSVERELVVPPPKARVAMEPKPPAASARALEPVESGAPPWRWTLGAGQGAALDWPALPWELAVEGTVHRGDERFGLRGGARVSAPVERLVDVGRVSWRRLELSAGPELAFEGTLARVALFLQAAGGPLWLSARSPIARSDVTAWDWGARFGVGLSPVTSGHLTAWLELGAVAWLRQHVVLFDTSRVAVPLPAISADVVLGVAFGS